jgi:hypothetical protein
MHAAVAPLCAVTAIHQAELSVRYMLKILKFLEFKIESCIYSPTRDLNELRKFEQIDII